MEDFREDKSARHYDERHENHLFQAQFEKFRRNDHNRNSHKKRKEEDRHICAGVTETKIVEDRLENIDIHDFS
jgi:hypothetical protein